MLSPISQATSLSARFALNRTENSLLDVFKRLSSGRRINSGKDDPAGLIASERLAAEIASLEAETRSLHRADSRARIAEGSAAQLSSLFSDLNVLVVSSANEAGLSDAEIAANQMQIDSIVGSIQRFHGDASSSLDRLNMPGTANADVTALYDNALAAAVSVASGGANDLSSGNQAAAGAALQSASGDVATARGTIGAYQRYTVDPTIRSNQIAIENVTDSRSRIVDTDYAEETSNLSRDKILQAAGVKVLKIVQQQARSVLALLS